MHGDPLSRAMIVELADIAAKRRKEVKETESMPKCILFALEKKHLPLIGSYQSAVASELGKRSRLARAARRTSKIYFSTEAIDVPEQPLLYPDATLGNRPGQTYMRYANGD